MNWIRLHRRTAVLLGVTLLLPVFFYLKTVLGLLNLGFEYRAEASRITPRLARLQGLIENEDALVRQSELARQRMEEVVYGPENDSSALAATLQADVRQILTEAGLSVSNSQVLPVRQGEVFDRVAVKLTLSGSLPALDAALVGIAAHRPRLLIESLDTFPARTSTRSGGGETQLLTAVMQLMVLRALP